MKIIRKAFPAVAPLLGEQSIEMGKEYRPISFCVSVVVDGIPVVYNSLTGEIAELSDTEYQALSLETALPSEAVSELIKKWYLVPLEHNDIQLFDEVLDFAKGFEKENGIRNYIIFTTTDCNARCFYCYQLGRSRVHMSPEVADKTVEFIKKNKPKGSVKLSWFGGEPLYNSAVIDRITEKLAEDGIEYYSKMVSNGYLFDDETVKKAKEKWKLQTVQITIDGTESVYNKAKAFIYKDTESPFKIVTDNIERLLKSGIFVVARMNVASHNKQDVYALADFLAERYKGYNNFCIYAHLILENDHFHYTDRVSSVLASDIIEIEEYCLSKGILGKAVLPSKLCKEKCMADSSASIAILPDGKLGKCEHFTDKEFVGSLKEGITETSKVAEFKVRANTEEVCKGCASYPICIQLKKCPNRPSNVCNAAARLIKETRLRRKVENTYRAIKMQKNKAE